MTYCLPEEQKIGIESRGFMNEFSGHILHHFFWSSWNCIHQLNKSIENETGNSVKEQYVSTRSFFSKRIWIHYWRFILQEGVATAHIKKRRVGGVGSISITLRHNHLKKCCETSCCVKCCYAVTLDCHERLPLNNTTRNSDLMLWIFHSKVLWLTEFVYFILHYNTDCIMSFFM